MPHIRYVLRTGICIKRVRNLFEAVLLRIAALFYIYCTCYTFSSRIGFIEDSLLK